MRALVVMGVSGSGKSTLARAIAEQLSWSFIDADDYHPQSNIEKMQAGMALSESDRAPWLESLALMLAERAPDGIVLACSALKARYRAILASKFSNRQELGFVYLNISRSTLWARVTGRLGHFMPPSLLDSQIASLEVPDESEGFSLLVFEDSDSIDSMVSKVASWVQGFSSP